MIKNYITVVRDNGFWCYKNNIIHKVFHTQVTKYIDWIAFLDINQYCIHTTKIGWTLIAPTNYTCYSALLYPFQIENSYLMKKTRGLCCGFLPLSSLQSRNLGLACPGFSCMRGGNNQRLKSSFASWERFVGAAPSW